MHGMPGRHALSLMPVMLGILSANVRSVHVRTGQNKVRSVQVRSRQVM